MSKKRRFKKVFTRRFGPYNAFFNRHTIVPRVQELRDLHEKPLLRVQFNSKIDLPLDVGRLLNCAAQNGIEYDASTHMITKANGSQIALTKWLSHMGVNNEVISTVGRAIATTTEPTIYKLSCSNKTIVNASAGNGWRSCYDDRNILELLAKPNVALAYKRSRNGKMQSRNIVYFFEGKLFLSPFFYPEKFKTESAIIESLVDIPIYAAFGANLNKEDSIERTDKLALALMPEHLYDEFYSRNADKFFRVAPAK